MILGNSFGQFKNFIIESVVLETTKIQTTKFLRSKQKRKTNLVTLFLGKSRLALDTYISTE